MTAVLDLGKEAFIVYMAHLRAKMSIYPAYKTQITLLMAKKVIILIKHTDFIDVFLKKLIIKFFKRSKIIKYAINLEPAKQSPYRPIYNLGLVEFKTLIIYIKTNLTNSFIPRLLSFLSKSEILTFICV